MNKKSQVSIFVIIGLILVIILGIVLVKVNYEPDVTRENKNFEEIEKHVTKCIEESALEAIQTLGRQGSLDPQAYTQSDDSVISFYYFKGRGYIPDQETIETQISNFVTDKLYLCINEFSDKEYVIDAEDVVVETKINKNSVDVTLDTPIKVYHHGQKDEHIIPTVKINANLKKIYETSKEIISDTINDPDWIQFDKLYENDLDIKIVKVNSSTIVYVITDNKIGLDKKPYTYRFAVKYDL